jgi:hypothetical protein
MTGVLVLGYVGRRCLQANLQAYVVQVLVQVPLRRRYSAGTGRDLLLVLSTHKVCCSYYLISAVPYRSSVKADSLSDYAPPLASIVVPPVPPIPSSGTTPFADDASYARSPSPSGRLSWLSTSTSSPTSPLHLNKDVCDAFPSVPQQRPLPSGSSLHSLAPPRPSFGSHTSSSQPYLSPSASLPIYDSMSVERSATTYTTRKPSIPSH